MMALPTSNDIGGIDDIFFYASDAYYVDKSLNPEDSKAVAKGTFISDYPKTVRPKITDRVSDLPFKMLGSFRSLSTADSTVELVLCSTLSAAFMLSGYGLSLELISLSMGMLVPVVFLVGTVGAGAMLGITINKAFYLAQDKTIGEALYDMTHGS